MNPSADKPGLRARVEDLLGGGRKETRLKALTMLGALAVCGLAFAAFGAFGARSGSAGLEAGKVADRDVVAEVDAIYVDREATAVRAEVERRLVPAVFIVDAAITRAAVAALGEFKAAFEEFVEAGVSREELVLRLTGRFPDLAGSDLPGRLSDYPAPANAFARAADILERMQKAGIVAMPDAGLEEYHPGTIELRRWEEGPLVYEQVAMDRVVTDRTVARAALEAARALKLSPVLTQLAADLAAAFARRNAFFDAQQSERRLKAAVDGVEPVVRRIAKGDRVIRKGFIVTADDLERLAALDEEGARFDLAYALGGTALLALILFGAACLLGRANTGRRLDMPSWYLILATAAAFFVLASALAAFLPRAGDGTLPLFLPTALISMLMAILFGERFGALFTLFLALSILVAGGMDAFAFALALASGLAGVILVRRAEKRIDLIRAGVQLGAVQAAAAFGLGVFAGRGFLPSLGSGVWSGLNGFFCGVLTLGFLPMIEQALNAPTVFRLQELSDLNAPALKRLLSVAPGTYSHAVTVAHLAESACREIGADALLARVGAYYHDIGKMEQPEYFIENQAGYNKHDDINPRLSATVIRSHVKFGIERAEALGLPESVKAIVAEHHGTSLISYFFDKAQKDAADAASEDYRYPGPLPSSRESAVVMLADCVEAASRTLKRPTMAKLEQFVGELIMDKLGHEQLVRSELTFKDLDAVKNTFARVLAGHFHSRIEYPKGREAAR